MAWHSIYRIFCTAAGSSVLLLHEALLNYSQLQIEILVKLYLLLQKVLLR